MHLMTSRSNVKSELIYSIMKMMHADPDEHTIEPVKSPNEAREHLERAIRACGHIPSCGMIQKMIDGKLIDIPLYDLCYYSEVYNCVQKSDRFEYRNYKLGGLQCFEYWYGVEGDRVCSDYLTVPRRQYDAMTLNLKCLGKNDLSGWDIEGEVESSCCSDNYQWVTDFVGVHPRLGKVEGNYEKKVYASSEEALMHFIKYHPPECWNAGDF